MSTHGCPGGCGTQVQRHQLACKPCWYRLPYLLRDAVNVAYRQRGKDPAAHRNAVQAAIQWYQDNPRAGVRR